MGSGANMGVPVPFRNRAQRAVAAPVAGAMRSAWKNLPSSPPILTSI
jgi:hypothetical protein